MQGDYKKKIKKPMDLGTIKTKLDEGKYADLEQSADAGIPRCLARGLSMQNH